MSIKQKIKSVIDKIRNGKSKTNSELAAEEVIEEEVFPTPRKISSAKKCNRCKTTQCSANNKPSKRTRPTNRNYTMIDPDDGSADTGKS